MHLPDKKPAEKVQLMAVLRNPQYIASIKEPAEKVQLAAVQKAPEYIRYIEEPTKKVQHMAVQGDPGVFRYIKSLPRQYSWPQYKPGEKISVMYPHLRKSCSLLQSGRTPVMSGSLKNRRRKYRLFVLHTDRKAAQLIRHPSEEVKRQAEEMYGVKLEGVAEVKKTKRRQKQERQHQKDNAAANENASAGKKSGETQKPSAKTVKAATEKTGQGR